MKIRVQAWTDPVGDLFTTPVTGGVGINDEVIARFTFTMRRGFLGRGWVLHVVDDRPERAPIQIQRFPSDVPAKTVLHVIEEFLCVWAGGIASVLMDARENGFE